MSAGLPVISSPDRGVLCELLKMHECGISYPSGNADALSAILTSFHDDRETLKKMSLNAVRLFQERFTADRVYTEMMAHLVMIAEKSKQSKIIGNR
jgi:glycosyltransferase involved in cell wall biosynthesis